MVPLHFAARSGPVHLVNLLLEASANASQWSHDGSLPIDKVQKTTREAVVVRQALWAAMQSRALLCGFLVKLGAGKAKPQRVFCVLFEEWLYFYADSDFSTAKGRVQLGAAERLLSPSDDPAATTDFSLELSDGDHTTVLCADSEQDLDEWVVQLQRLIEGACVVRLLNLTCYPSLPRLSLATRR